MVLWYHLCLLGKTPLWSLYHESTPTKSNVISLLEIITHSDLRHRLEFDCNQEATLLQGARPKLKLHLARIDYVKIHQVLDLVILRSFFEKRTRYYLCCFS